LVCAGADRASESRIAKASNVVFINLLDAETGDLVSIMLEAAVHKMLCRNIRTVPLRDGCFSINFLP
jgi:hypothetical protein